MKRITLVAALTLLSLATFAQAETVPYTSDMRGWTAIDANNDGNTWTGDGSGIRFCSNAELDDWIVSPAIPLEAGTEYIVRFKHKRDSTRVPRKAKLYAALADDAESLSAGMIVADFRRSDYQQWERYTQTFTPAESGNYHFGFYAYSSSTDDSCIDLWLAYFEVQNDEIVPMPVSDLAISFGTDSAVEATLSWTLPTEDTEGFALDDDATYNAVYIYRDDELVQTLPGNATTWTDSEASGMTAADHTYEVEVEVNGVRSSRSSITYMLPRPLPYLSDFNDSGWTIIDVGNDGKTWHIQDNYYILEDYYRGATCDHTGSSNVSEDWLISPPLLLTAGVEYTVKFKYRNGEHVRKGPLALYASTQNSIEGLTSGIRIIANVPAFFESTDALYSFTATESDYYYLGFCAMAYRGRMPIYMTGLEVASPSITGIEDAVADGSMRRAGDSVLIPDGATDITLVTVSGQVLRRCAAADSIDLSQLAPGVYIVSCNLSGKRTALKIAK